MPVFAQSRPDVGMNPDDLPLQVEERPPRVSSHHRTVRSYKLAITQHPAESNRGSTHRIEAPRMTKRHTPLITPETFAFPHLDEGVTTLFGDPDHGRIPIIISPKLFCLHPLSVGKDNNHIIRKGSDDVSCGQDQSLFADDHPASCSATPCRNEGHRGSSTPIRERD